jgi:PAS domain S-box-containing protein
VTAKPDMDPTTSESCYRAVFREAAHAILVLDDSRRIIEANPATAALAGISVERLVGRLFEDLMLETGSNIDLIWREMLTKGEAHSEHRMTSPSGTRVLECSYRARVQPDRHLCIAHDITDRRQLEERVVQAEKIESIGRLAGGIAHDFNNLLTAILGYTELLLANRRDDDPDRADLEEVQKAGQRAAVLTQQLLAFSRKQVLLPKNVDLNQTVSGLRSMLTRLIREDIALECETSAAPAWVRIDPHQIEQVILNLVLNARDALPGGGRIHIDVCPVSVGGGGTEGSPPPGEYVRLRISDDGVGMSAETRSHLFEPFFTTKQLGKGTGLGLASVYGIVRQSNGFISVESEPGSGSTFTMHFPVVSDLSETAGHELERAARSEQQETILLVEDEEAVRRIISASLRRQGYRVLEAATPGMACEIVDHHPERIDLLLSDVVMPEMNGPALAQRLVGARPSLRVLFISGYADMLNTPNADGNPNIDFLGKPFKASALADKVRAILARPPHPA